MSILKELLHLGKKDKKKLEESKKKLDSKERHFNNALEIPFMEAKGAYHILAQVLGLEHIKEGIFEDKFVNKFVLTKYGFQDCVQYNYKYECLQLEKALANHTEARLANFQEMEAKIKNQKEEIRHNSEFRENIKNIMETEDNLYAKLELIEELLNNK